MSVKRIMSSWCQAAMKPFRNRAVNVLYWRCL
jgi:hypothetical protein